MDASHLSRVCFSPTTLSPGREVRGGGRRRRRRVEYSVEKALNRKYLLRPPEKKGTSAEKRESGVKRKGGEHRDELEHLPPMRRRVIKYWSGRWLLEPVSRSPPVAHFCSKAPQFDRIDLYLAARIGRDIGSTASSDTALVYAVTPRSIGKGGLTVGNVTRWDAPFTLTNFDEDRGAWQFSKMNQKSDCLWRIIYIY